MSNPADVFALATAAPVKTSAGPTQYRALRDALTDDGQRLQLVARVPDGEPFMLVCKLDTAPGKTAPVAVLNAANVQRHKLRDQLAQLPAEGKRDAAQSAAADKLNSALKALPRVRAIESAPVARGLMLYARQDSAAAPAAPADPAA